MELSVHICVQMNRPLYVCHFCEGLVDVNSWSVGVATDSSCTQKLDKTADVSVKAHSKPLPESHTPDHDIW